jgi:tetratricopeptide (TPR) repeat protein
MNCGAPVFRTLLSAAVLAAIASPGMVLANQVQGDHPSNISLPAAGSANLKPLLASAQMWEGKNRTDLARNVLQKILFINPEQIDALGLLGIIEIRSRRLPKAKLILDKLLENSPEHSATRALAEAYRIETKDRREMAEIRHLARSGKPDEAAPRLRALFPSGAPLSSELAVDYYRILAGTPKGRTFVIAELTRIANRQPDNLRIRLLLASLLTERHETRQSGLKMAATLAVRSDGDRKATLDLWRRTLTRLDADSTYQPWFERYLQEVPGDNEIRAQQALLHGKVAQQSHSTGEHVALRLETRPLGRGVIAEADSDPTRTNESEAQTTNAVGELGLSKLREGHHDEAQALFEQALRLDPKNSSKWSGLRETAIFWGKVNKVRVSLAQGRHAEAEADAQVLLAIQPENETVRSLLADALLAQGKKPAAETILRELVDNSSPDVGALEKLVKILRNDGRAVEAEQIFSRAEARINAAAIDEARRHQIREARANLLSAQADDLVASGKDSQALAALEESVRLRPDHAWTRYSLARLYRRIGIAPLGRSVMDEGLKVSLLPDMRYAAALFLNAEDDVDAAMAMLVPIPEADRSEAVRGLHRNLAVQKLIKSSSLQFKNGNHVAAEADLRAAAPIAEDDPEALVIIAREWIAQGQIEAGLHLVDSWIEAHPNDPAVPVRLRYGELLASAERDYALGHWLDGLDTMTGMNEAQRLDLEDQRFRFILRRSSRLIDAGKLDAGEAGLMSLAQEKRTDRRWLLVLADLRQARRDFAGAADATRQAVAQVSADDVDARLDAARRFATARREQEAKAMMDALSAKFPDRPDIILQNGKLAQARGGYDEAAELFRQALTLEPVASSSDGVRSSAEQALDTLNARRQGQVATAYMPSSKPGDNGISRLDSTEIPFYARIPVGYDGHAFFHADTVTLDAGSLFASDMGKITDHGKVFAATKGAVSLAPDYTSRIAQQAQGIALAAGYETDDWRFDLGTTPLGFPVQDIVGGIRYRNYDGPNLFSINVSRRPVSSSLVSYAGTKDLVTGEVWGGVRRNGINLHYGRDVAIGNAFIDVGAGLLTGKNVQTNLELTLRTGVELPLLDRANDKVTTGVVFNNWQYSQNQSYYTFGQGGYYSPQSYLSLSMPLDWMGRNGLLSYRFRGSVGYSKSSEDSADYYPTRSQLQADSGNPAYSGGSGGGVSYNIKAAVEYRVTSHWAAGADLEMDRSTYYAPDRAIFYLRYFFEPQTGAAPIPPDPVRSYRSY